MCCRWAFAWETESGKCFRAERRAVRSGPRHIPAPVHRGCFSAGLYVRVSNDLGPIPLPVQSHDLQGLDMWRIWPCAVDDPAGMIALASIPITPLRGTLRG
mmetsp:Transcript_111337/g.270490  ORF Transcript_111337/g.270490 Transcript_111337/m.270490 type:complete len:101 (+) Transcript_111337:439-741(+)